MIRKSFTPPPPPHTYQPPRHIIWKISFHVQWEHKVSHTQTREWRPPSVWADMIKYKHFLISSTNYISTPYISFHIVRKIIFSFFNLEIIWRSFGDHLLLKLTKLCQLPLRVKNKYSTIKGLLYWRKLAFQSSNW